MGRARPFRHFRKVGLVTAGGQVDLEFAAPGRVDAGAGAPLSSPGVAASPEPSATLDLLGDGTPAPLGFDPSAATRHFQYRIGRRIDHRHNLEHAADGLIAPLAYTDVTTPHRVGGAAHNRPS